MSEQPRQKNKVLVVANRTAASDELIEAASRRVAREPAEFVLVVPATPRGLKWAMNMHAGEDDALSQLNLALQRFREAGLDIVHARIGDPDPVAAAVDAAHDERPDSIIVSTLPRRVSKWLRIGAPDRIGHQANLDVEHVTPAGGGRRPSPPRLRGARSTERVKQGARA